MAAQKSELLMAKVLVPKLWIDECLVFLNGSHLPKMHDLQFKRYNQHKHL